MRKFFQRLFIVFSFSLVGLHAGNRDSSAPYISGDTFRTFCDFTYDELRRDVDPQRMRDGDTIFVKTDYLNEFFSRFHPQIASRYILVTHNSDFHVPGQYARYLDDEKIIAWFGQNIENCAHPKMHPIPIGIANQCWPHGNISVVTKMREKIGEYRRTILVYMNFTEQTFHERRLVSQKFRNAPYCTVAHPKDFSSYLADLAQSVFVLSPRGNGVDTHRTWEALLMGAIPIVRTSSLDPLFENLPVLIIKDWDEVNQDFLVKKYEEIRSKNYQMERAFSPYWLQLIESYRGR